MHLGSKSFEEFLLDQLAYIVLVDGSDFFFVRLSFQDNFEPVFDHVLGARGAENLGD